MFSKEDYVRNLGIFMFNSIQKNHNKSVTTNMYTCESLLLATVAKTYMTDILIIAPSLRRGRAQPLRLPYSGPVRVSLYAYVPDSRPCREMRRKCNGWKRDRNIKIIIQIDKLY